MGRTFGYGCLAVAILCCAGLLAEQAHPWHELASLEETARAQESAGERSFKRTGLSFPATGPAAGETSAGEAAVNTALIDQKGALQCLALNLYHEARSEPLEGQIAVAAVTLNRVRSGDFPDSVCGVVKQGGQKQLNRCQFSWWCDGKSDEPANAEAWAKSEALARRALFGELADPTGGALWYHATYVSPFWSNRKVQTAWIGRHIFYRRPNYQHYIQVASTEWQD